MWRCSLLEMSENPFSWDIGSTVQTTNIENSKPQCSHCFSAGQNTPWYGKNAIVPYRYYLDLVSNFRAKTAVEQCLMTLANI